MSESLVIREKVGVLVMENQVWLEQKTGKEVVEDEVTQLDTGSLTVFERLDFSLKAV